MSTLGLLDSRHTIRPHNTFRGQNGAFDWQGMPASSARSRIQRPLVLQGLSRNRCRNSRIKYNVTSSAAAIAISGAGSSDPVPDTAGVLKYQRELLGRMMSFLGPATVIPLGEPLMSLVDTVCIGQFAGTSQLAALGPANLVFSFCQYFLQSLQVATLSLLAGFMRDGRLRRGEELLSTALAIAALMGVATTCILEAFPQSIIMATGLRDPALLPLSLDYVRVRGLAQPAVLVTMVAQSGLLAQQDSLTPALTVAVTVALSLLGSVVFVAGLGWGLVGAAATTVACQYVGAAALLYCLSVRGKLRVRLELPRRDVLWQLLSTMGPLSITYICKNVSYLFIQTTAATLETTKLAAHQALFAVWNLLAWTVTPFEQAALTYLPGTRGWRKGACIALLVGLGALGGITCGLFLAALVCAAPGVLTRDAAVHPHLQSVASLASASMLALGADVVASGVNIAMGDARYVAKSYIITLVVLAGFMGASRFLGWELPGVWSGVVVFFGVRALQSTGRVFWQHLRHGLEGLEVAHLHQGEKATGREGDAKNGAGREATETAAAAMSGAEALPTSFVSLQSLDMEEAAKRLEREARGEGRGKGNGETTLTEAPGAGHGDEGVERLGDREGLEAVDAKQQGVRQRVRQEGVVEAVVGSGTGLEPK